MAGKLSSRLVRVSITGTSGQLVPASAQRVGIAFMQPTNFDYGVSTEQMGSINDGCGVKQGGGPVFFVGPEYEELVQKSWNVITSTGNVPVCYVEILRA